jgi:hypothetical protein
MDARTTEVLAVIPWVRFPGVLALLLSAGLAFSLVGERLSPGLLFWIGAVVGLGWLGAASLRNRAVIRLRGDLVEVVHRPLPWRTRRIPRDRVRGLRLGAEPSVDGDTASWCLDALTVTGERVRLVDGPSGARYAAVEGAARALSERLGVPLE